MRLYETVGAGFARPTVSMGRQTLPLQDRRYFQGIAD